MGAGAWRLEAAEETGGVVVKPLKDVLDSIVGSLGRKCGAFGVAADPTRPGRYTLAAGAPTAMSRQGCIVTLGITREQLVALRDDCDALLAADPLTRKGRS
jgi:hypothetical protein